MRDVRDSEESLASKRPARPISKVTWRYYRLESEFRDSSQKTPSNVGFGAQELLNYRELLKNYSKAEDAYEKNLTIATEEPQSQRATLITQ